jgi:hypothetical protein
MIICSIDPSLVTELSAESDLPHKTEFSRRTNLRDSSLGNLITSWLMKPALAVHREDSTWNF